MRLLVTGAKGMLGSDLCPIMAEAHTVFPTDIEEMDVRDPNRVFAMFEDLQPEVVLHLAALTDVDGCEKDPDSAFHTNALGTRHVALACKRVNAVLVYISTLSVFDGSKCEPYTEFDTPNPQSWYSRSKYHGELAVREIVPCHYIVRAGWMFGGGPRDKKFVARIMELARERPALQVVDDKIGSPVYTRDLSCGLRWLIGTELFGTYHMVNSGYCSRFELAQEILRLAGIESCRIEPVSSAHYPLPALRPRMEAGMNYVLRLMGQEKRMCPWQEALAGYIAWLQEEGL